LFCIARFEAIDKTYCNRRDTTKRDREREFRAPEVLFREMGDPQEKKVTGQPGPLFPIFRKDFRPPKEPLKMVQVTESEGPPFAKRPRKTLLTQERDGNHEL